MQHSVRYQWKVFPENSTFVNDVRLVTTIASVCNYRCFQSKKSRNEMKIIPAATFPSHNFRNRNWDRFKRSFSPINLPRHSFPKPLLHISPAPPSLPSRGISTRLSRTERQWADQIIINLQVRLEMATSSGAPKAVPDS